MWVDESRGKYRDATKFLMINKDWREGGDCLEQTIGSTWWEWMEGSRSLFWRWPKEFWWDIRDVQNQWKVGPWTFSLQPQRVAREDRVASKEYLKLAKDIRRGYVRVGDVKILTNYFSLLKGEDIRMV